MEPNNPSLHQTQGASKHYSVGVDPCPPRRGNRKGSVEKSIHYLTQRWWRTARVTTMVEAQASLDRFCVRVADKRRRPPGRFGPEVLASVGVTDGGRPIVGLLATLEDLTPLPVPFPATVETTVKVGASALARFDGNAYSVPAGLIRTAVMCRWRLGTSRLESATATGMVVAAHKLAVVAGRRAVTGAVAGGGAAATGANRCWRGCDHV